MYRLGTMTALGFAAVTFLCAFGGAQLGIFNRTRLPDGEAVHLVNRYCNVFPRIPTTPISYGYQWQRCDTTGANCADIAGATAATYTATAADTGRRVRVVVTATNTAGSASATNGATVCAVVLTSTLPMT